MQNALSRNEGQQRNIWRSGWFVLALVVAVLFALSMFLWECRLPTEIDLQIHAHIAVPAALFMVGQANPEGENILSQVLFQSLGQHGAGAPFMMRYAGSC